MIPHLRVKLLPVLNIRASADHSARILRERSQAGLVVSTQMEVFLFFISNCPAEAFAAVGGAITWFGVNLLQKFK